MTAGAIPASIARAVTPETLFAAVRVDDAARPLVTFYDDATGERMELSPASLGNWVAKTHFLITDELGLGPGDRAFVDLPSHWLRLAIWFGAWSAGLEVTTDPRAADAGSAAVAFVGPDRARRADGIDDVYALALAPWGKGFEGTSRTPAGTQDFVVAVRPQPDAWASVRSVAGADDAAFDGVSRAGLVSAARALAAEHALAPRARVAISDASTYADSPVAVLAALSVAGSVVLTRGGNGPTDEDAITRRDRQERITHRL